MYKSRLLSLVSFKGFDPFVPIVPPQICTSFSVNVLWYVEIKILLNGKSLNLLPAIKKNIDCILFGCS